MYILYTRLGTAGHAGRVLQCTQAGGERRARTGETTVTWVHSHVDRDVENKEQKQQEEKEEKAGGTWAERRVVKKRKQTAESLVCACGARAGGGP